MTDDTNCKLSFELILLQTLFYAYFSKFKLYNNSWFEKIIIIYLSNSTNIEKRKKRRKSIIQIRGWRYVGPFNGLITLIKSQGPLKGPIQTHCCRRGQRTGWKEQSEQRLKREREWRMGMAKKEAAHSEGERKTRGGRHAIKVVDLKCHLYVLNQFPFSAAMWVSTLPPLKRACLYRRTTDGGFDACPDRRMETKPCWTAAIVRVQYALRWNEGEKA